MQHLQECDPCNRLYQKLSATYRSWDDLPDTDPGPFFHTRVEQRLKNAEAHTGYRLTPALQSIAFGILAIAGIFVGIMIGQNIFHPSIDNTTALKKEVLQSYANEYYLYGTGSEENIRTMANNE